MSIHQSPAQKQQIGLNIQSPVLNMHKVTEKKPE